MRFNDEGAVFGPTCQALCPKGCVSLCGDIAGAIGMCVFSRDVQGPRASGSQGVRDSYGDGISYGYGQQPQEHLQVDPEARNTSRPSTSSCRWRRTTPSGFKKLWGGRRSRLGRLARRWASATTLRISSSRSITTGMHTSVSVAMGKHRGPWAARTAELYCVMGARIKYNVLGVCLCIGGRAAVGGKRVGLGMRQIVRAFGMDRGGWGYDGIGSGRGVGVGCEAVGVGWIHGGGEKVGRGLGGRGRVGWVGRQLSLAFCAFPG